MDPHVIQQVKNLLEFYFSDGNLANSSFMIARMAASEHGAVNLDVLTTFNKLKSLTTDYCIIRKAVNKSKLLALTDDKNSVYRVVPMRQLESLLYRSIYVANIQPDSSHETLRECFSNYGEVLYISLPRYGSTKHLRGFAFVDFATSESAIKALKDLRPKKKDERKLSVWRYLSRMNTQTYYLERNARKWDIDLKKFDDTIFNKAKKRDEGEPKKMCALSKSSWLKYRNSYRAWHSRRNQLIREAVQNARDAYYTQNHLKWEEEEEEEEVPLDTVSSISHETKTGDDGYETQVSSVCSAPSISSPSFTPGLILHLVCLDSVQLSKKKIRSLIGPLINQIAYIDVIEGACECFLRAISPDASQQMLKELDVSVYSGNLTLLEGLDEGRYWERVETSVSRKKASNTARRKKRLQTKRQFNNLDS